MHLFPSTSGKIRDFHALDVGVRGDYLHLASSIMVES